MRVFITGLIGGIVFFLWGAMAHTVLPLGDIGMKGPADEKAVMEALRSGLPAEGIYHLPYLAPDKMQDEAAKAEYSTRAKANPYAFVVYQPQGHDALQMTPNLGMQFVSDTLSALVVAFVLALGNFGFGRRVLTSAAIGLFAWLAVSVPYWNWYRFPTDFTLANLAELLIGWTLAGAAMAWWLGRTRR
jgi:hypothetical protein